MCSPSLSGYIQSCFLVFVAALLLGCGGGGGGDSSEPDTRYTISGQVQKGLFTRLEVKAIPIDKDSGEIDTSRPVVTSQSNNSDYSLKLDSPGPYKLEAKGRFINEVTREPVELDTTLDGLVRIPEAEDEVPPPINSNINLLTHVYSQQVLARVSSGVDLAQAETEAKAFVDANLGFDPNIDYDDLSFSNISPDSTFDDPNLQLLLFTSATLQSMPEQPQLNNWGVVIEGLGAADNNTDAQNSLSLLSGNGGQSNYELVQDQLNLPDLDIFDIDQAVYTCDRNSSCQWRVIDGPSVSLVVGEAWEADGIIPVRIELSGPSPQAVNVHVQTIDQGASSGIDYVPLNEVVTIPAGQLNRTLDLKVLLDALDEQAEFIAIELTTSSEEYEVANGFVSVRLLEGLGDAGERITDEVQITDLCITGIGTGITDISGACSSEALTAISNSDQASIGLKLGMTDNCELSNSDDCDPYLRDWGVELYLDTLDGDDLIETYKFAQYRFANNDLAEAPVDIQAHLDNSARTQILGALNTGYDLQIRAQLPGLPDINGLALIPRAVVLPESIQAADKALRYQLDSIVQASTGTNTQCAQGEYALSGQFSLNEINFHQSDICIALSSDRSVATLTTGVIPLAGDAIDLPPFHSSFLHAPSTKRPFVLGAPTLVVPFGSGEPSLSSIYLHREGLPFAFKVTGAEVNPSGLQIDYNAIYYLPFQSFESEALNIASNDILYSSLHGEGQSSSMRLSNLGLQTRLTIPSGDGQYAYPKASLAWEAFEISIVDSQISPTDLATLNNLSVRLTQDESCTQGECLRSSRADISLNGSAKIDGDGVVHGQLSKTSNFSNDIEWGQSASGAAFSKPDDLVQNATGMVSLPGYLFTEHDEKGLDIELNAHIEASPNSFTRHSILSEEAIEGNFWPTGITLGPEWYASLNSDSLPLVGSGRSLAGTALRINNGFDEPFSFNVNLGTKYVLRNAGVTGAFNIDVSAVNASIPFFGYDMEFDRFGFRLVDNSFDSFSWIDGRLHLPDATEDLPSPSAVSDLEAGAAGFDIEFQSLALNCEGRFDGGIVNAPATLQQAYAWKADTDIYGLRFEQKEGQPNQQCSNLEQYVTLDQTLDMRALNTPVKATNVQWQPDGALVYSEILANQSYILDGRDNFSGFSVLTKGGSLETLMDESLYGVVKLNDARMLVDFWQAPRVDIRLANTTSGTEPSVVVGQGTINGGDDIENAAFALADNRQYDIDAKYHWGNTRYGFDLPTYYNSGDSLAQAELLGRYQSSDLIVLEAGAGIDYIHPEDSKLSFGLSADIARVQNLPLSLDIASSVSTDRLSSYLSDIGLGNLDLSTLLAPVQAPLQRINDLSGSAIDRAIKSAVKEAISNTSLNELQSLSTALSASASIPTQVSAFINQDIETVTQGLELELSTYQSNMGRLSTSLKNIDLALEENARNQAFVTTLNITGTLRNDLSRVIDLTASIESELQRQVDAISAISESGADQISRARSSIQALSGSSGSLSQTFNVDASACAGGTLTVEEGIHLSPMIDLTGSISTLSQVLSSINLTSDLSQIAVNTTDLLGLLERSQSRINNLSSALALDWEADIQPLRASVCAEDSASFTASLSDLMISNTQGNALDQQLAGLEEVIEALPQAAQTMDVLRSFSRTARLYAQAMQEVIAGMTLDIQISAQANLLSEQSGALLLQSANERLAQLTRLYPAPIQTFYAEADSDAVDVYRGQFEPLLNAVDSVPLSLNQSLSSVTPRGFGAQFSPDELLDLITDRVVTSPAMRDISQSVQNVTRPYIAELTQLNLMLTDQINGLIKQAIAAVIPQASDIINAAEGYMPNVPMGSGGIDGFAVTQGRDLIQIHLDARWDMKVPVGDVEGPSFNASLDAYAFREEGDQAPCNAPPGVSGFDVEISARDVGANFMGSSTIFDAIDLNFVLAESDGATSYIPTGIGGGIHMNTPTDYQTFTLNRFGLTASIGANEVYLGAGGHGTFDSSEMGLNLFVGKTCNDQAITSFDPDAANYLPFDGDPFLGLYLRGELTAPFLAYGCALDVSFRGNAGTWITTEPTVELGGIIGGGAMGSIACLGSVRGQLDTAAALDINRNLYYSGRAFVVGGAGADCDRGTWTSARRSRRDDWCGTADVSADVEYKNNQWDASVSRPSGIH